VNTEVSFVVSAFSPNNESIPKAGVFNAFDRLSNKFL
jgi:hypothetical protein